MTTQDRLLMLSGLLLSALTSVVIIWMVASTAYEAWQDRQWVQSQEWVQSEMERQCSLAWPLHGANYQACLEEWE